MAAEKKDARSSVEILAAKSAAHASRLHRGLMFFRRRWLPLATLLVGITATFFLMAQEERLVRGPLWGALSMALATGGLLALLPLWGSASLEDSISLEAYLGSRRLPFRTRGTRRREAIWMTPPVTFGAAVVVAIFGSALLGSDALPAVVTLSLLLLLPSAFTRPSVLVLVVVGLVYLPLLGSYGLWDPWETHYGEVAREILARDDWISLWWAQDGWFWSKPILIFWIEAFSLGVLGVPFLPDANPGAPEWAIRLPIACLSMLAVLAVYGALSRIFGKRAGVISALALATAPHFLLLSHQAITDMAFVAPMVIAMCCLLMALRCEEDAPVPAIRIGRLRFDARGMLVGALFLAVAPQSLYLFSRNLSLVATADPGGGPMPSWARRSGSCVAEYLPYLFSWHADVFYSGSGSADLSCRPGACLDNPVIPGNVAANVTAPVLSSVMFEPGVQAIFWAALLALLVGLLLRQRRAQSLWMVTFYFFCAVSFMGKGIPGLALPGLISLLFLLASGRWSLLLEGRLKLLLGVLTVAVVALPWYVAMYVRHGPAFTDRLLVHDHINRVMKGVHGDTGSLEYFLEQLGYGTFPWVGLVPLGLSLWYYKARSGGPAGQNGGIGVRFHQGQTLLVLGLWFFGSFSLFSAMVTKFHHYIFPAVPPLMMLAGLVVARCWGKGATTLLRAWVGTGLALVAPAPLVAGVGGLFGDLAGVVPEAFGPPRHQDWALLHPLPSAWGIALCGGGLSLLVVSGWLLLRAAGRSSDRRADPTRADEAMGAASAASVEGAGSAATAIRSGQITPTNRQFDGAWVALGVVGTVVLAFVARDLSWSTGTRPQGFERLIHLFVYNYERPWPEQFDFRPVLTGFGVVGTTLVAVMVVPFSRRLGARALVGFSLLFSLWCLDVYIPLLSPHWGQRELVKRYYAVRRDKSEPLVAWQMNWKGENFYTGNQVHVYADVDNEKIRRWIDGFHGRAFFVMEHGRLGGFRGLVRNHALEELSDKRLNNKFVLVRVDFE